jgi:hypothetical protein
VTVLVVILLLVVELFELDVGNELLWAFLIINTVEIAINVDVVSIISSTAKYLLKFIVFPYK